MREVRFISCAFDTGASAGTTIHVGDASIAVRNKNLFEFNPDENENILLEWAAEKFPGEDFRVVAHDGLDDVFNEIKTALRWKRDRMNWDARRIQKAQH